MEATDRVTDPSTVTWQTQDRVLPLERVEAEPAGFKVMADRDRAAHQERRPVARPSSATALDEGGQGEDQLHREQRPKKTRDERLDQRFSHDGIGVNVGGRAVVLANARRRRIANVWRVSRRYVAVQSPQVAWSCHPAGDAGSSSVQPTDREGDGP